MQVDSLLLPLEVLLPMPLGCLQLAFELLLLRQQLDSLGYLQLAFELLL